MWLFKINKDDIVFKVGTMLISVIYDTPLGLQQGEKSTILENLCDRVQFKGYADKRKNKRKNNPATL